MFEYRRTLGFLTAVVLVGLASCAARPPPVVGPPPAPGTVYEVVASDVTVLVYRDGMLKELGHNHVIASTGLTGRIELREPLEASSLSLDLPLASLVVDDPARREMAGTEFPDNLSESDRQGTRSNMLGAALLDAAHFPTLRLTGLAIDGESPRFRVTTRVSLAGREREIVVPVELARDGQTLTASGSFTVTHAELGLSPFTAAMGALRVREDMKISYHLSAQRPATGT
jgi:polyisoprenoid-binding protein YceI